MEMITRDSDKVIFSTQQDGSIRACMPNVDPSTGVFNHTPTVSDYN